MTTPNNTINDGDVLYGSTPVTLGGVTFETDDIKMDPEITRFVRTSSKNIPNGRVSILGEYKGSMTLMYPTSTTVAPVFGASGTLTWNTIVYNITITKVGLARTKAGETKIPVDFDVNLGTVVLSVQT